MGVREMTGLEQWQMGVKDLRRRVIWTGAVRHPAAGPGLDGSGDGGGAGAGPPHYRTLGVGLRRSGIFEQMTRRSRRS